MNEPVVDIMIVGAGPVGLMCAYLAQLCGMTTMIVDKSAGPLTVGRADALNARTLQLLQVADLFDELYAQGKICNTSSVFANGQFISRQSSWWSDLEGCEHKHFLMLGQAYIEKALDERLKDIGASVRRLTTIQNVQIVGDRCISTISNEEKVQSRYVIGADGSQSFVRQQFQIPFEIIRPQIVWAVVDGIIETDFPKVPEIIVFQADTSDVAWIPREGSIDRFYVRMDTKEFSFDQVKEKIDRAIKPYRLEFKEIAWFSQFSVKESVAEAFSVYDRIFLAGDACHIHSVNGGQGLNTGLADAFNLIWKLNCVVNHNASSKLLQSYETERRPVALSVIQSSGELVRSTKYSATGTHAQDYVKIVEKRAGNITGMGIRYGDGDLAGTRLFDLEIYQGDRKTRLYTLLDYRKFTLLIFGNCKIDFEVPKWVNFIHITQNKNGATFWMKNSPYENQVLWVRPDSYIESAISLEDLHHAHFFQIFRNDGNPDFGTLGK